jgi:hypothetical protein
LNASFGRRTAADGRKRYLESLTPVFVMDTVYIPTQIFIWQRLLEKIGIEGGRDDEGEYFKCPRMP